MELKLIINEFLENLLKIGRFSGNTHKSYQRDLLDFQLFCDSKSVSDITAVTEKIVRAYIIQMNLNSLKYQTSTISRKLSALRSLFNYAVKNDLIEISPLSSIPNPRVKRKLPEVAPESSLDKISEDLLKENKLMYNALFEVLYCTAIRVSELCSLNMGDIDFDRGSVRITGKGSKTRVVPIGKETLGVLRKYLDSKAVLKYNDPIFLTPKNKRIYPRYVYRIINRYLSKEKILKKNSPHILRHTAATHMLDHGADLLAVKEILGHESLSTTQIYTHVSVERLKAIYKQAHPKS